MAVRLRIISEHRRLLGERSTVTFGSPGGTIGRSSDNDWVLPDPQRYVSAHHARIHCQQGTFVLEDVSTNGVFVNDDEQPLGKNGPYRLRSGDVLRMGEYQLVVAIEAGEGEPDPRGVPTQVQVVENLSRAAQTDLGAPLDLDELLTSDHAAVSGPQLVDAYGQAVARPLPSPAEVARAEEEAVARRMERLARAAAKAREARAASLPMLFEVQSGLQALCRGAGIDAEQLPHDAQTRLLHLIGQLLREALVGLKELERARHELHNRFRIELAVDPDDPRPSLTRSTLEELLIAILSQHESRRLDAVQWLRDAFEASKVHERALTEALRVAFVDFIGRLEPAELEARFERAKRRGKSSGDAGRNWTLFVEFYRNLTDMPADHLPHTFVEAFANAYKQALIAARQPPAD
ncbi:MAG TPA: type VI secretion system-associated FHA domain protein TagH [Steroidobacteraceae bacterium]|nr:type VI secretion system-associated FHA domain protein TagH [Steroidobacteraceae bacterium]